MSGPSDKAVKAALVDHPLGLAGARLVLSHAHDPALGLDRSVRLGDVVDAFLHYDDPSGPGKVWGSKNVADYIAREFG